MTIRPFTNFTTGPTTVPDVGVCSYNGCLFGPLFSTEVSGKCIQDDARRTTKLMEYVITIDGYVTLPDGHDTTTKVMGNLRSLLTAHAGTLTYQGRGNDILVNLSGKGNSDVAWGPQPELLEFQPLGGGHSAKVKWSVIVRIYETQASGVGAFGAVAPGGNQPLLEIKGPVRPGPGKNFQKKPDPGNSKPGGGGGPGKPGDNPLRMLQFNYESTVTYGEDGYSILSNKGILEIPLTRSPNQATRTFDTTADALRGEIERRVMSGIDLRRFRMTRRNFTLSRDKRSLTWDFTAEEKPYMDLPPYCSIARGSYSVKPATSGMGFCSWMCTLRCTYTVIGGVSRRAAWAGFLALLRLRMSQSEFGNVPDEPKAPQAPNRQPLKGAGALNGAGAGGNIFVRGVQQVQEFFRDRNKAVNKAVDDSVKQKKQNAFLIDFSIDEGMYLDSKTISFSASWKLVTTFSQILIASGIWTKVSETDANGKPKVLWATTLADISGVQSWLGNKARTDVIVDLGGG